MILRFWNYCIWSMVWLPYSCPYLTRRKSRSWWCWRTHPNIHSPQVAGHIERCQFGQPSENPHCRQAIHFCWYVELFFNSWAFLITIIIFFSLAEQGLIELHAINFVDELMKLPIATAANRVYSMPICEIMFQLLDYSTSTKWLLWIPRLSLTL